MKVASLLKDCCECEAAGCGEGLCMVPGTQEASIVTSAVTGFEHKLLPVTCTFPVQFSYLELYHWLP